MNNDPKTMVAYFLSTLTEEMKAAHQADMLKFDKWYIKDIHHLLEDIHIQLFNNLCHATHSGPGGCHCNRNETFIPLLRRIDAVAGVKDRVYPS